MLPHRSEVSHILGQQQGLLHGISYIPSRAPLEVSGGGITGKRNSIQLQRWGPG